MVCLKQKEQEFEKAGIAFFSNIISTNILSLLRNELVQAVVQDEKDRPNVFDAGMVHNCMFRGREMRGLLDCSIMNRFVGSILGESFLVYAYQSSSLRPEDGGVNYGTRPHVDSPRFIEGYPTNIGVIFALDDFTIDNGATYFKAGSHLSEQLVDSDEFYRSSGRVLCKAGDMIVFHGRLQHAAGTNITNTPRHALTINFCRSFMRQRFDYSNMILKKEMLSYSENTRKLLGWNVRMPTSLDQFYLPESERLYKPNQG